MEFLVLNIVLILLILEKLIEKYWFWLPFINLLINIILRKLIFEFKHFWAWKMKFWFLKFFIEQVLLWAQLLLKFTGEIKIRSYKALGARIDFYQTQFDIVSYKILILYTIDSQEMGLLQIQQLLLFLNLLEVLVGARGEEDQ